MRCLLSSVVLTRFFVFFDFFNVVYLDNLLPLVEGYIDDDGVYGIVCRWKWLGDLSVAEELEGIYDVG